MRNILLSKSFLLPTFIIALVYVVGTVWLMNFRLVDFTLFSSFSFYGKLLVLRSLLGGIFTALSPLSACLLILAGVLTGANITLAFQKIAVLKKMGKLQITIGGGLLLGIIGSGCAGCGLPIIALFGLSGGIFLLPFHGAELSILSIILLSFSFILLVNSIKQVACDIPERTSVALLTNGAKYENIEIPHGKSRRR